MDISPKILYYIVVLSAPTMPVAYLFAGSAFSTGWALGIAMGILDTWILLQGVQRTKRYAAVPRVGLARFKIYTFLRLANVTAFVYLVLRVKDYAAGLCMGFLLIHIFLIFNLTIVARRSENDGSGKKGE